MHSVPKNAVPPLIIFHCEFSQKRGPRAYQFLRELDSKINETRYPALYYPQLYIIGGGYKNFHEQHPDWCVGTERGSIYVGMIDKRFQNEFQKNKAFERKHWPKKATSHLF